MIQTFQYKGCTYSGRIVSSTDLEPHFHWFLFIEPELIDMVGDCIAFRERDGHLLPVHSYSTHVELVNIVQAIVEQQLNMPAAQAEDISGQAVSKGSGLRAEKH